MQQDLAKDTRCLKSFVVTQVRHMISVGAAVANIRDRLEITPPLLSTNPIHAFKYTGSLVLFNVLELPVCVTQYLAELLPIPYLSVLLLESELGIV